MNFIEQKNRIYAQDENGKLLAEITFPERSDSLICIDHTFVDPSLRGKGIAGELIEKVIAYAKANGKKIGAECPYAVKWLEKHPEHADYTAQR